MPYLTYYSHKVFYFSDISAVPQSQHLIGRGHPITNYISDFFLSEEEKSIFILSEKRIFITIECFS